MLKTAFSNNAKMRP